MLRTLLLSFWCCLFLLPLASLAHSPDLSSIMLYEQNGRKFLVIKSSLTAFEGVIDYVYKKDSYKTPQAFNELVIQYFRKTCVVMANGDTVRYKNPQVQLGHETSLFAELDSLPASITSLYVKNEFFKDMPNNICELIVSFPGKELKQVILHNVNQHTARLQSEGRLWGEEKIALSVASHTPLIWGGIVLTAGITFFVFVLRQRRYPMDNFPTI